MYSLKNCIDMQFLLLITVLLVSNTTSRQIYRLQTANPSRANFKCSSGEVIPSAKFCDGRRDCADGSDEITNESSITNRTLKYQRCTNSANLDNSYCLIPLTDICNGNVECKNFSKCDADCTNYYTCQTSGLCVSRATICDGNSCSGCPEDHEWPNGVGFKCRRNGKECILPQQLVWDGVADCDGGIDLCVAPGQTPLKITSDFRQLNTSRIKDRCFQCLNDPTIIHKPQLCDGIIHCPDLSDECLCENTSLQICNKVVKRAEIPSNSTCKAGDFKCNNGRCIPRTSVCNGISQCSQAEDEDISFCDGSKPCTDSTAEDTKCRCETRVDTQNECYNVVASACNGIEECKLPLGASWAEPPGYPPDECRAKCGTSTNFSCTVDAASRVGVPVSAIVCHKTTYSPPSTITIMSRNGTNITLTIPGSMSVMEVYVENTNFCDGYKDCPDTAQDESNCPNRFNCSAQNGVLINIDRKKVCDGFIDCDFGEDETMELCDNSRFFCPSLGGRKVNIEKSLVCDGSIACDNRNDEQNCTNDGRFYCESGKPLFVIERKVFDGRLDCSDWSDECPTNPSLKKNDILNSRYQMIGNTFLRVLVWIMGLAALFGNTAVIITVVNKQKRHHYKDVAANMLANRLYILNLAVADLLMGIYLLGLGIAGLTMEGRYCAEDLNWRSGSTCVAFGVLSVLSSETSVATMILLTISRLYAIKNPLSSATQPKLYVVLLGILAAWVFSIFIAFLPLSASLQHLFIYQASFNNNPFAGKLTMDLDSARTLIDKALDFDLSPNISVAGMNQAVGDIKSASWRGLADISSKYTAHPEYYKTTAYFGYYSIDSVCIPKFFVTTSDRAWRFSFTVTLFNFLAFVFVAASYGWIYYKSLRKKSIRQKDKSAANKRMGSIQRKILRLIITDLCCWMPICIIAFCKISGAYVGDTAYAVSAIVLLPINSALNPILYSDIPEKIYSYCAKKKEEKVSRGRTNEGGSQETNLTTHKQSG